MTVIDCVVLNGFTPWMMAQTLIPLVNDALTVRTQIREKLQSRHDNY